MFNATTRNECKAGPSRRLLGLLARELKLTETGN